MKEYVQALLDQEIGVENDKAVGEREDIVTGSYFEEIPDRNLQKGSIVSFKISLKFRNA